MSTLESVAAQLNVADPPDESVRSCSETDRLSLQLWKSGNMRGYNELVERYKKPLFVFINRTIRDADEAKDVLQETFIRMYRSKDTLREDKNIKSWLYQTANNLCIDLFRKKKPDRVTSVDHQDPAFVNMVESSGSGGTFQPDQHFEETFAYEKIVEAIQTLPKKQRMMMAMRSCEGLSLSEIAEVMECSERTVGTTLFAARKKLIKTLQPVYEAWYGKMLDEE